ncbi:hypothetical protein HPB52_008687 [Rhipicephalus sanguineus]|uniref:DDE Tnp4 domain-containing protein n=1 Tax=Rhipicephalus sanguineus TaxID=34632 RepID=A0A9D4QEG2_RHISA|nr:hypothetical protein HPB52_008687 [Rhipicephalus sanguineus]
MIRALVPDRPVRTQAMKKLWKLAYTNTFLTSCFGRRTRKPKVEHFVDDVVRQYSDEEFRRHFRLSRRVATELIAGFASSPMCPTDNHGGKAAKSAETHLLSFIWYAANKTCMRDVADRFNLAESTVHRVLQRVADYLCTLGPTVLTFPRDLEKLSRDFEKVSGVPGVVGCIDGCYIRIQCPENKIASTYVNRHHFLSMTLQAVCDNKRRFSDVLVGSSSKIHDSRVFRLSSLAKKIPGICQGGRYHILGDELLDDSDEEEANDDVPWSKCTDSDESEEEDTEEDAALRVSTSPDERPFLLDMLPVSFLETTPWPSRNSSGSRLSS